MKMHTNKITEIKEGVAQNLSTKTGTDLKIIHEKLKAIFELANENMSEYQREIQRELTDYEVIQYLTGEFSNDLEIYLGEDNAEKIIGVISEVIKKNEKEKWNGAKDILDNL